MKIQLMPMKGSKKNKLFHLILFLGAFIILNVFNDSGSNADKSIETPIVTGQSGVFVSKCNQYPVFTMGSKVSNPQNASLSRDALISYSYQLSNGVPGEMIQAAINAGKKGLHLLIKVNEDEINNKDITTSFFEHQEDWDEIDGVGVNISGPGDMAKLDRLYKVFADKKEIIINENIIEANALDLPQGIAFLKEFYYALAIKLSGGYSGLSKL